jgi:hypothetical protein
MADDMPALGGLPALQQAVTPVQQLPGYVNPRRALWGGFLSDMANHFLSGRTQGTSNLGPRAMFDAIQSNQTLEQQQRLALQQQRQAQFRQLQEMMLRRQISQPVSIGDGIATYDQQSGQWSVQAPDSEGGFEGMGNSEDAWARRTLYNPDADPSSPEYRAAYDYLTSSRLQQDPQTGRFVEIRRSAPQGIQPPEGYQAPEEQGLTPRVNDTQAKAGEFFGRMLPAVGVMTELEQQGYRPTRLEWAGFKRSPDTAMSLMSPEAQRYFRAVDTYVRAKLRRESGAAISAKEYEDEGRGAIILPGMEGDVIRDVQRERLTSVEGIRRAAGPSLQGVEGIDEEIELIRSMFMQQQAQEDQQEMIEIPGVDL